MSETNPSGHGGRRVGSGRPSQASVRAKQEEGGKRAGEFTRKAIANLSVNYETLQELASGVWVLCCETCRYPADDCGCGGRTKKLKAYRKKPDLQAAKFLVEQAKGKAGQASIAPQQTSFTIISHVPRPRRPAAGDQEI